MCVCVRACVCVCVCVMGASEQKPFPYMYTYMRCAHALFSYAVTGTSIIWTPMGLIDKSTTWCVCVNVSCLKVSSVQGCPYREVPVYVHIMYVGKVSSVQGCPYSVRG